ncbi:LL-diaminopimelate aminotransferase [bacterium]|nr:LL-diaminopimelate aminotransferase [bacterium]
MKKLKPAQRILDLPPYLFKEIDDKKKLLANQGKSILNFGIGDPDMPTPGFILEAMAREMRKKENQKYPDYEGCGTFRNAAAKYMETRFKVNLDPSREVIALIGSKEGLAHFSWAFIDPGDLAIVPDPGYPVYKVTTEFSGGEVYSIPLMESNGFFPDVSKIPQTVTEKAKVLYLNYPNNPTGMLPALDQLKEVVKWAQKNGIIIVSDAAYAELVYDPSRRFSLLSIPGAKEVTLEFHSFSKTFNMTGWRIGFAVGNSELVAGLLKMKTNVDSGAFEAIQLACVDGLSMIEPFILSQIDTYRERKEALLTVLRKFDWDVFPPDGAFYVWARCPKGISSKEWTLKLMEKTGIVTTPGSGFGKNGEGFVRFALTQPVEVIRSIESRLGAILYSA